MSRWKYYNHAVVWNGLPNDEVDLSEINSGKIWKIYPDAFFVRYTTDYDCEYETDWWYIVKDAPFDEAEVSGNSRNKIRKGIKRVEVTEIAPLEYADELYEVFLSAEMSYPKSTRNIISFAEFKDYLKKLENDKNHLVYAAFFRETSKLCGYLVENRRGNFIFLETQKTVPEYNKHHVSAALVSKYLENNAELLSKGYYCCNGERTVNHQTNFNDFLKRYFNFKKVYCKLNIVYNPKIKTVVKIIYPFRKILNLFDGFNLIHKINSVLLMENIRRSFKNE